jgi:protein-S-isoprenylcysteine O-methyltransferase Ste14
VKFQKVAPLAFTILGIMLVAVPLLRTFLISESHIQRVALALFALSYVMWMAFESRVTKGELTKEVSSFDKFSMEFAAVVKITMLMAMFVPSVSCVLERCVLGFGLAWCGILLRGWGIVSLGNLYSHRIRVPHEVVARGPYAFIRHPAYLGTALAHAGFVLVFFNLFALVGLCFWFFAVWLRAHIEERALLECAAYQDYSKAVRFRMFPFFW